eukprot:jgi/Mesvir1/13073/Mv06059-RA.1
MAKFGEGDARWIVEEREDGTNVHGWHWQEKDCLPWAKERFGQLLGDLTILNGEGGCYCRTVGVESVTGEAYVNRRKGKLIPGYELEVKVKWEGMIKDGQDQVVAKVTGKVKIPYIADENAGEDPDMTVTADGTGAAVERLKAAMTTAGRPKIAEAIRVFVKEIAAGGGDAGGAATSTSNTKSSGVGAGAAKPEASKAAASKPAESGKTAVKAATSGNKRTITIVEKFHCRPQDIYEVFVDERRVSTFTRSKAEVKPEVGGRVSLFEGAIVGEFVALEPGKRIVQTWRSSTWPDGVFSQVEMTITEPDVGNTVLKMVQTDVPVEDRFGNATVVDQTEQGWRGNIFTRIRAVFGY